MAGMASNKNSKMETKPFPIPAGKKVGAKESTKTKGSGLQVSSNAPYKTPIGGAGKRGV